MKFIEMISSKRFLITMFMMIAWLIFGFLGIKNNTNMSEFAAYFAALSPFVIGYIYGETKRSSGTKTFCECKK